MSHCVVGIVGYAGSAALATMLYVQPTAGCLFLHSSSQRLLVVVLVPSCKSAPVGRSGRRNSAPVSDNSGTPSKCTSKTTSTTSSTTTSKAGVRAFAVWLCLWRFLLQHMDLHEDRTIPCSSTRPHLHGTNLTPSTQ